MSHPVATRALLLCLAACAGACGENAPAATAARAQLASCNDLVDCPPVGACFTRACSGRRCIPDPVLICVCGADSDCNDSNPCTTDSCSLGSCNHVATPAGIGCCIDATGCIGPNRCQAPATCTNNSCTFIVKPSPDADCCDGSSECGTGGATCFANICTCPPGEKYCPGSRTCVPSAGCCTNSDCDSTFSNGGACSAAGNCTYTSCDPGRGDCDQTPPNLAGCETNTTNNVDHCGGCGMSCSSNNVTRVCTASVCSGTCSANFGDCNSDKLTDGCETDLRISTPNCGMCGRACSNANVSAPSCAGGLCTSSCQPGSGNCTRPAAPNPDDGCETNTSADVDHCGACPMVCSFGNACQTRTCTTGSCGFAKANLSGCCAMASECTTNSCQNAACTANTCVLSGKVGVSGCCNIPANCPAQSNPCTVNTCINNMCGTMTIAGCVPDMAMPDLMPPPPDLRPADMTSGDANLPADLSVKDAAAPPDLGADLAVPDLAPPPDAAVILSLTGGGGCQVGAGSPGSLVVLLVILAVCALRRRPE